MDKKNVVTLCAMALAVGAVIQAICGAITYRNLDQTPSQIDAGKKECLAELPRNKDCKSVIYWEIVNKENE